MTEVILALVTIAQAAIVFALQAVALLACCRYLGWY